MNEETNCELCHDGTSDEWECPSCCRKIVESRPEPRQDWDGDEEGFLLFKMMSGYEEEMAREEWTAKHSSSTASFGIRQSPHSALQTSGEGVGRAESCKDN